jgi:hypothetical protein
MHCGRHKLQRKGTTTKISVGIFLQLKEKDFNNFHLDQKLETCAA